MMPRHWLLLACSAAAPRAAALVAPRPRVVARPATSLPPPPPRRPSLATQRRRPLLKAKPIAAAEKYTLYESRWAHLFMLSFLAFVSDWVCFATAANPGAFSSATGRDPAEIIDLFLLCNVASCFLFTDIAKAFGLQRVMVAASVLMTAGCFLRSGVDASQLPDYDMIRLGTALVGFSQPFFQCSPPLLSATWFGQRERATATATALNANQLGIAAAFVVGGLVVGDDASKLPSYFLDISAASLVACALTCVFFRSRPPTPPTASAQRAVEKSEAPPEDEPTFLGLRYPRLLVDLLQVEGFNPSLGAFVCSIGVTNVISAFAAEALQRAECPPAELAVVGAAFQVAIVLGGVLVGGFVDETRTFKRTTLVCLMVATACVTSLGLAEGFDQHFPNYVVVGVLLLLGGFIGPVQPINAELAVEVAYPADENAIEATQQLSGNLASALLVPLYQFLAGVDVTFVPSDAPHGPLGLSKAAGGFARAVTAAGRPDVTTITLIDPEFLDVERAFDMRGDDILLLLLLVGTIGFFSRADFDLRRSAVDDAS